MELASIYLTVNDMERALSFYAALLKQKPTHHDDRYSSFILPDGKGKIDLYNPAIDGEKQQMGNNVVPVFRTDNLEHALSLARKIGATIVTEPMTIGEVQLFQCEDSEGNTIEIYSERG